MRKLLVLGALAAAATAQSSWLRPLNERQIDSLVSSSKGQILLLNFWATWCSPCREEMPWLVQLARKYHSRGVRLITVSCDEPEDRSEAEKFLKQVGVPGPAYIKHTTDNEKFIGAVSSNWSGALPATFLYDRNGKLVRAFIGETTPAQIESALKSLLN